MKTISFNEIMGYKIEQVIHNPSSSVYQSDYFILLAPNGELVEKSIFYDELNALRSKLISRSSK